MVRDGILSNLFPEIRTMEPCFASRRMTLRLSAPQDGALQDAFIPLTISFEKSGTKSAVNLYYSFDGGETLNFITQVPDGQNSYVWTPVTDPNENSSSAFSITLVALLTDRPSVKSAVGITLYHNTVVWGQAGNITMTDIITYGPEDDLLETFDTQTFEDI